MRNRYSGTCFSCGKYVEVGEGVYDTGFGKLFCTEMVTKDQAPESLKALITSPYGYICLGALNEKAGTEFATMLEVFQAAEAERKASLPSPEQIAANKAAAKATMAEDAKRRRQELADYKKRNICPRCHGKGGSDAWQMTGWTCNRCHGSGRFA